jgi:trimethylguanosine synthase
MQDTCTSSDSEEQDMSLEKADNLMETRDPEPEKCQIISSATELEAEKSEVGSLVATVPENCSTEEIPNSPHAETEGKNACAWGLERWLTD